MSNKVTAMNNLKSKIIHTSTKLPEAKLDKYKYDIDDVNLQRENKSTNRKIIYIVSQILDIPCDIVTDLENLTEEIKLYYHLIKETLDQKTKKCLTSPEVTKKPKYKKYCYHHPSLQNRNREFRLHSSYTKPVTSEIIIPLPNHPNTLLQFKDILHGNHHIASQPKRYITPNKKSLQLLGHFAFRRQNILNSGLQPYIMNNRILSQGIQVSKLYKFIPLVPFLPNPTVHQKSTRL